MYGNNALIGRNKIAVVREKCEMMYKRVSSGLPKFERNKFTPGCSNTGGFQQSEDTKRGPENDAKGKRQDKFQNCGNRLKPNNREHCPSRNILCNNCSRRGHFAKHYKKATVNQVDDSEFTQYEMNVLQKWDTEKTEEEFGVFAKRTVWDETDR